MRLVVLESPYRGRGIWPASLIRRLLNVRYARRCVRDSLSRGEAPIASHLLYTQRGILRDRVASEREWGIAAGVAWYAAAVAVVVYENRGISGGMARSIELARELGKTIEYRSI